MNIQEELYAILDALNEAKISYALCGGLAVAVYGHVRATEDIDLLVQEDDIEVIKHAVEKCGFTLSSGKIPLNVKTPEATNLFRVTKVLDGEYTMLDLLTVSPHLQSAWDNREARKIGNREIVCISYDSLLAMKETAGRPKDLDDIEKLSAIKRDK